MRESLCHSSSSHWFTEHNTNCACSAPCSMFVSTLFSPLAKPWRSASGIPSVECRSGGLLESAAMKPFRDRESRQQFSLAVKFSPHACPSLCLMAEVGMFNFSLPPCSILLEKSGRLPLHAAVSKCTNVAIEKRPSSRKPGNARRRQIEPWILIATKAAPKARRSNRELAVSVILQHVRLVGKGNCDATGLSQSAVLVSRPAVNVFNKTSGKMCASSVRALRYLNPV